MLDQDKTDEKKFALAWILPDLKDSGVITYDNLGDLVRQGLAREPTPSGKARLFLLELNRRSRTFGKSVQFDPDREWPLIKARGREECRAIIEATWLRHLIENPRQQVENGHVLTWSAWEALEPLRGNALNTAFVAMAFHVDMNPAYAGIKAAIERAGLTPIRVDKETFPQKICDRILTEIHSSEFVVADFTLQSSGVYFEAGYALALGKPIIWCCRADEIDKLHFDTRQYPHIVWTDPADLSRQLLERLRYLIVRRDNRYR